MQIDRSEENSENSLRSSTCSLDPVSNVNDFSDGISERVSRESRVSDAGMQRESNISHLANAFRPIV
jgi:hypothetical protein